jgi:hypothetical protein
MTMLAKASSNLIDRPFDVFYKEILYVGSKMEGVIVMMRSDVSNQGTWAFRPELCGNTLQERHVSVMAILLESLFMEKVISPFQKITSTFSVLERTLNFSVA